MTTVTVNVEQTPGANAEVYVPFTQNAWTEDDAARRRVPFFVPRNQAYYWTLAWQEGEAEALREIGNGDVRRFPSGAAAADWLLSDDDEEQ